MIDLDGFKRVNDELGHDAGDAVLKAVASALLAATRKIDVVARYGGDEFVILLPNTEPDGARAVSVRMLDQARDAARRVCPQIPVSASIGTTALRATRRRSRDAAPRRRATLRRQTRRRRPRPRLIKPARRER